MKAKVMSLDGKAEKEIELPTQFDEEFRPDLIKRAVQVIQSRERQPYGAMEGAGMRAAASVSRRRRKYRGSYGKGIARVPRKILTRRGSQINWVGAFAPGTVSGRRAHPPKAWKIWGQEINAKERKKAIRCAIAATAMKAVVEQRGFSQVPIIVTKAIEHLSKAKDVVDSLEKLGLKAELERASEKKVRSGKGKARGRKYRKKKGPLLVVSGKCTLQKAAAAIPGVDIAVVSSLNAQLLAPGTMPGRITVWSESAIEKMGKEKLFI